MPEVRVLAGSPILLSNLIRALAEAGITAEAAEALSDQEILWSADAVLIDTVLLRPDRDLLRLAEMAQLTAVILLHTGSVAGECEAYLEAGVLGVISKDGPVDRVIAVLRMVTSVGGPAHGDGAEQVTAPDRADPAGRDLSAREQQVLDQISQGLTHGQIATRLGISPHTVNTYVKRIRTKLGVGNKAELTRVALRHPTP